MKKLLTAVLVFVILFGWFEVTTALASTTIFQITSLSDAINEDGAAVKSGANPIWLGNGMSAATSYTGIRFANFTIPNGAVITSARLSVYSVQNQWIPISMSMAGDLSPNSLAFSSTNRPSQRDLTTHKVNHNSNVLWSANTWYTLDDLASVVQEIVDQAGWQSGNSLSIILKGSGNSWGRKNVAGYSTANNNGPKLEISYTDTATSTPGVTQTTQLISPTPAITSTPTRTFTALPPTPTSTRTFTALPPTPTSTRTPTALAPTPTFTPTTVLATATPGSGNSTAFSLGFGYTDVIPHQFIRTTDDRVYFFGTKGESSSILQVYWTTVPGLPNTGSAFTGSLQINNGTNIISVAAVYDGSHIIHVLTNGQNGQILDRPFDTTTNQFKTMKTLDTAGATVSGYYVGSSGITGMMDQSLVMHIAFWSASKHIIYRSYTYNVAQDVLSGVDGPTQLDINGNANHPNLAISPLDGSVTVVWVSQASSPARILARTKRSGNWAGEETVSNSPVWTSADFGINIDQGPSLLIGLDGTRILTYIENWRISAPYDYGRIHYATNSGAGWSDLMIGSYSHNPAVAINSTGQIYIIGHGYPLNTVCKSVDDFCLYARNNDGTWATPRLFLAHQGSQSFDSSPSVKWSVVGFNRPNTIEFFFADVGTGYENPILYYGRIDSN